MKAVILAGGMGTRLREETEFRPKPMVEIGGRPILWHIMKTLSAQGINDFVICLGYKGDYIKDFFMNYEARTHDITVKLGQDEGLVHHSESPTENWTVTLANTGAFTMTGGRINLIKKYVTGERFLCTYGDGVADIDLKALNSFHEAHGKIATVTSVRPTNRFGSMQIDKEDSVTKFEEKPLAEKRVNGGYFIFEPEIFNYLNNHCTLEKEPLEKLSSSGELKAFNHDGFWQPMDTFRETLELNELWDTNQAPWKIWD
jgi:glucose-1-phosphate cytidylyltransferase